MQDADVAEAEDFGRIRETQVNNIIRILNNSYKRMKISLILPRMARDLDYVEEQLRGTLYKPAISILKSMKNMDMVKFKMTTNREVLTAINYFQINYHIVDKFPRYLNNLSEYDKALLFAFNKLLSVAKRHLHRTAKSELSTERILYTMHQEREATKRHIEHTKKKIRSRCAALRWKRGTQFLQLEKLETELASRKWKNNVRIQNEIGKRGQILRENHKATLQRQEELREELERAELKYEDLVKFYAARDKEIRAEKEKLLIQLSNLLRKYDTHISEKLRENLELQDKYLLAQKKLDDFMIIYRREEAAYKNIVVKYEQEEQRKQQQKILLFMMNRAARKIQMYWQKWRQDRLRKAKRQSKMKKGKKK